jgi:hypothetical protein
MYSFMLVSAAVAMILGVCEIIKDLIHDMLNAEQFARNVCYGYYPGNDPNWYDHFQCETVFSVPEDMDFSHPQIETDLDFSVESEDGLVELVFGTTRPDSMKKNMVFINTTSSYLADVDLQYRTQSWEARSDLTKIAIIRDYDLVS